MFISADFQNNYFIVKFLDSMFTLQTSLTCTREVPALKLKLFGKSYFFQKRLLSPEYEIKRF